MAKFDTIVEEEVLVAIPESEYKFLCHCRDSIIKKLELENQELINKMFVDMVSSQIKESL